MAEKLAYLIKQNRADYLKVVRTYGKYKTDIDFILTSEGFEYLIAQ